MLDIEETPENNTGDSAADTAGNTADAGSSGNTGDTAAPAKKAPARKTAAKRTTKKAAAAPAADGSGESVTDSESEKPATTAPAKKAAKKAPAKRTTKKVAAPAETSEEAAATEPAAEATGGDQAEAAAKPKKKAAAKPKKTVAKKAEAAPDSGAESVTESTESADSAAPGVLFQVPETAQPPAKKKAPAKRTTKKVAPSESPSEDAAEDAADSGSDSGSGEKPAQKSGQKPAQKKTQKGASPKPEESADSGDRDGQGSGDKSDGADASDEAATEGSDGSEGSGEGGSDGSADGGGRRRRRRGGRRRRGRGNGDNADNSDDSDSESDSGDSDDNDSDDGDSGDGSGDGSSRRRRSRQRKPRNPEDEIASVSGSTRLEAKKQRRREGREAGRRRAPIVSEAEFLARRESVERVMVIRQREDLTQIGVIEDKVLVEHYVARKSQTSLIGNVYLGRVQNVLPSMEAAFIDIGKGRNAVLYAGEVNWAALGHKDGKARKIESVLSPGQTILVQVTKDPIGHKGARLSGQVSLPGRFLVYVPDGNTSGISRKLPDTERNRLKKLLKEIVPDTAGVIVRTAAEGASEEELTRDVERLTARWNDIEEKVKKGKGPELLYGEPDLTLKVVRDLFTEDFSKLVVQGDDAWDLVQGYVAHVAPDLEERLERFDENGDGSKDIFAAYRVNEQIAKGLDRKVWLPSGGSLIIDRTEAMTVVDVNTGKFTGSGGNLEETVTKNNLEAAEEMVRQLRLRDIGGIIVIDFIDMVLESNRELVLRRLVECLGRDRTRHQVAEVTSLGLVQMTRKRIGTGLVESFSEDCTHCKGRGVIIHDHPVESDGSASDDEPRNRRGRGRGRGRGDDNNANSDNASSGKQSGKSGQSGQSGQSGRPAAPAKPPSPADLAGSRPKSPEDEAASTDEAATDEAASTEAASTDEPAAKSAGTPETAGSTGTAQEEPTQPAPPAGPTVVTTTRRRRTATRPAGPPAGAAAVEEPKVDEPKEPESKEPEAKSPEPQDPAEATETPEAPATPEATEAAAAPGETATPDENEATEDEPAVLHVPVKRKGTKKR